LPSAVRKLPVLGSDGTLQEVHEAQPTGNTQDCVPGKGTQSYPTPDPHRTNSARDKPKSQRSEAYGVLIPRAGLAGQGEDLPQYYPQKHQCDVFSISFQE